MSAAVEGLAVRWAETDVAAVTRWALQQEDSRFRTQALGAIPYGIYLKNGFSTMTQWWQGLPEEHRTEGFVKATIPLKENPNGQTNSPEDLWSFIEAGMAADMYDPSLEKIWAETGGRSRDPDTTLQRLLKRPNTLQLAQLFFNQLATTNGPEAVQRALALPEDSPVRQTALFSTCMNQPEVAPQFMHLITDPAQRSELEARLGRK